MASRTRKIRCDGAKPVCHNCGRRTNGNSECNYDPIPKRRGPDKTPGARQRMARDIKNHIDKTGVPSRRRRRSRANSTLDSNQTSRQQPQARHGMTADSPPVHGTHTIAPTGSPNSYSSGNTVGNTTSHYGRSFPPECACHRLTECPDGSFSSGRKLASSVSVSYWRRTLFLNNSLVSLPHTKCMMYPRLLHLTLI